MKDLDSLENEDLNRLQQILYLVPIVGFFPALWTLYRRQGTRQQQSVSRLSVTLALSWLLGYLLLSGGAHQTSEFLMLRLLFINSLLTSGYFLVCIGLMLRLWQRQPPRLPWFSRIAEDVVRKHLS